MFRAMERSERIQALIDLAEKFRPVPASIATRPYPEDQRVPACESEAFVFTEPLPNGCLKFHFAVENPQGITARALAVILDETCSGAPLSEVAAVPGDVIFGIFGNELSMGKSVGLAGIVAMVQAHARRGLRAG